MCFTAYHNPDGLLDENLKAFMKSIHPAQHKYMFKKKIGYDEGIILLLLKEG